MKLVEFEDGSFGVRVFWVPFIGWYFRDLISPDFVWSSSSKFFNDCKGTREAAAHHMRRKADAKHRVVFPQTMREESVPAKTRKED